MSKLSTKEEQQLFDYYQDLSHTDDEQEARKTKKIIDSLVGGDNRYRSWYRKHFDIFSHSEEIENKRIAAIYVSALHPFYYFINEKTYQQILPGTLRLLQHEWGPIREATRRNVNQFRVPFSLQSIKNEEKMQSEFTQEIEKLIRKYQPEEIPFAIEGEQPSVYKTLVLVWFEFNFDIYDNPHFDEILKEKGIPRRYDLDQHDSEHYSDDFEIQEFFEKILEESDEVPFTEMDAELLLPNFVQMLWGEDTLYSEVNIIKQARILGESVSRTMMYVQININPATMYILYKYREELEDDLEIQKLMNVSRYSGRDNGFEIQTMPMELGIDDDKVIKSVGILFQKSKELVSRIHTFVMDKLKEDMGLELTRFRSK